MNIQAQTHVWTYSVNNIVTNTMFTIGMRHVMGHSSLQITGISSITAYSPGLCDQHALCSYVFICNIDLSFRNQRSCSLVTWCDAIYNDATFSCIGYWNKVLIFIDQYHIRLLTTSNKHLPLIRCWNWTHGTSNFLLGYRSFAQSCKPHWLQYHMQCPLSLNPNSSQTVRCLSCMFFSQMLDGFPNFWYRHLLLCSMNYSHFGNPRPTGRLGHYKASFIYFS